MKFIHLLYLICLIPTNVLAATSSYSTLDFNNDCKFKKQTEEEASMGSSGICKINGKPDIYFSEGDLRQSVGFGANKPFETFSAWNSMNTTIEWRHSDNGKIYAAIVRFFIENPNPSTGIPDKKSQGQVLVIHNVTQTTNDQTCVIGLVDSRGTKTANLLAREIADEQSQVFNCKTEIPKYHGKRSKSSSDFSKPLSNSIKY